MISEHETIDDETQDDDEFPVRHDPPPSGAWIREHREKLIATAERNETDSLQDALSRMIAKGEEMQASFKLSVCGGEEAGVSRCDDANERACDFARDSQCPKRIIADRREQRIAQRKRLEEAGVSERVLKSVFDNPPWNTEAVRLLDAALARNPCFVVLQGGVGCGKSSAAALWATRVGAHWIRAKKLARMSQFDETFDKLESVPALVIDDLGTEYLDPKGFFLSGLDGLLDARYADELPTVITTNVPAEDFKLRFGARIASRIRESRAWLEVGEGDLRALKVPPAIVQPQLAIAKPRTS